MNLFTNYSIIKINALDFSTGISNIGPTITTLKSTYSTFSIVIGCLLLSFGYQGQGKVSLGSLQQVVRGEIGISEVLGHAAVEKKALSRTRYFTSYDLNDQKTYYSKMIQHRYF
ncbi:hypothetical protein [Pseudoalteromonas sp. GB56]